MEEATDAGGLTGYTNCEGRGRIEKLYLINRDGYTLGLGFIDADGAGSAGFMVADGSVCLGVFDADDSVCLGVFDADGSLGVGAAVTVIECCVRNGEAEAVGHANA